MVDTLEMGGTERMSINIAKVMADQGFESHLVVSRRSGGMSSKVPREVNLHFLEKKNSFDLGAFMRLLKLVRKFRPQIFHAHSTSVFWAIGIKILTGKFQLVWHDHFGLSDQLDQYPRKEMVPLSKWIDKVITVNDKLTSYWRGNLPLKPEQIITLKNFPFLILPKTTKNTKFTFLHLANFRAQKNHFNLIQAVALLKERRRDFEVVMVGEIVEKELYESILNRIKEENLSDFIHVKGPSLQVEDYLATCHAGVLSSDSEGLPVALLEYGLAALPVICTQVGDCDKVISSDQYGYLIPPSDAPSLADAMEKLLESSDHGEEKGKALKQKIEVEYGSAAFFSAYSSFVSAV